MKAETRNHDYFNVFAVIDVINIVKLFIESTEMSSWLEFIFAAFKYPVTRMSNQLTITNSVEKTGTEFMTATFIRETPFSGLLKFDYSTKQIEACFHHVPQLP